jgi:hypothetical protein
MKTIFTQSLQRETPTLLISTLITKCIINRLGVYFLPTGKVRQFQKGRPSNIIDDIKIEEDEVETEAKDVGNDINDQAHDIDHFFYTNEASQNTMGQQMTPMPSENTNMVV